MWTSIGCIIYLEGLVAQGQLNDLQHVWENRTVREGTRFPRHGHPCRICSCGPHYGRRRGWQPPRQCADHEARLRDYRLTVMWGEQQRYPELEQEIQTAVEERHVLGTTLWAKVSCMSLSLTWQFSSSLITNSSSINI